MPADIAFNREGQAQIAYAGTHQTPWHRLGTNVGDCQTAQDMLVASHNDWRVETRSLYLLDEQNGSYDGLTDWRAVVRQDTGTVLGVVTPLYKPVQNHQAADMLDALVTEGGAHVQVMGALGQGERCWALADIPGEFEIVQDHSVRPRMLLAWGHDGKHGLAGKLTPIYVCCANTLAAAGFGRGRWREAADVYLTHRGDMRMKIAEAHRALGLVRRQVEQTVEAYRLLAKTPITDDAARTYFSAMLPPPSGQANDRGYAERLARWEAAQFRILRSFEGAGQGAEAARGTWWGAYQALTDYMDHDYPVLVGGAISDTRVKAATFGGPSRIRTTALLTALETVQPS
jgi:phage/plasmid-like protein (TIGR03299 family)